MIEIVDCVQGTDAWRAARLGLPTASNYSKVMAGGGGKVRSEYMRKLAGEIVTGLPAEEYRNIAMDRGNAMEASIRNMYAMMHDAEPKQVGFIKRTMGVGSTGCSPDSLLGDDGILEIKTAAPHILIEIMKAGQMPPEHMAQCMGSLLVTDRAYVDIVIGYTGMPLFHRKLRRNESYISQLTLGIKVFNEELAEMVAWIRSYGNRQ